MIDFRNNNDTCENEKDAKIVTEINELKLRMEEMEDKVDALQIIRALEYRIDNPKGISRSISPILSDRVFYKLSGLLIHPARTEKSAYVFEGPSQVDTTYSVKLPDGRILNLTLMEISHGNETKYYFVTRYVDVSKIDEAYVDTTIKDLNDIINYYSDLYLVYNSEDKGISRERK